MADELTIATSFNFAPLWRAIRLSNTDAITGDGRVTVSSAPAEISEHFSNFLKSLGDNTHKGRLTLGLFMQNVAAKVTHIPNDNSATHWQELTAYPLLQSQVRQDDLQAAFLLALVLALVALPVAMLDNG